MATSRFLSFWTLLLGGHKLNGNHLNVYFPATAAFSYWVFAPSSGVGCGVMGIPTGLGQSTRGRYTFDVASAHADASCIARVFLSIGSPMSGFLLVPLCSRLNTNRKGSAVLRSSHVVGLSLNMACKLTMVPFKKPSMRRSLKIRVS